MKHQAQANDFYCGPATASMIVNFKGKTTTQKTFAGASYLQTDKLGASPFWTERMAPSLNSVLGISRYRTVHKPSLATLKGAFVNSVNARYPLAVGTVELKGTAYNGHPSGTVIGHWIVGRGYDNNGTNLSFADPATSVWPKTTKAIFGQSASSFHAFVGPNGNGLVY